MSDNDPTTLITEDDIHEVLSKSEVKIDGTAGLDFANALLYHLEEALETHYGTVARCQCLTPLQVADIRRGYCTNCFGAITLSVSGKAISR